MTFQVHQPHPAGQCFGPKCSAPARETDRGLIPRFCSDPCKQRFVAEHNVFINPATTGVRINPELGDAVVRSALVPTGQAIVAAKPETFMFKATPPKFEQPDAAELQRHVRELAAALAPMVQQIGLVLQRGIEAVRPAFEQLHDAIKNTPPAETKARALWLHQNRGTGPARRPRRAPRHLDTTARRRTR
ncbi:hypothetical protein SK571_13590 [Lentzea sp. BCCO 10_0798]|uniref:YHS domain-containing protein n=1 Tax=Lentzea kristufekii TaxID=3095430 RepID=A0ABU4TQ53_9PSEU|nr:hypothetical protein [Lentzea sp. BCCO 10_0798]MDX8050419.1 hypothetical protein [Lentzea sp. BCCO 10_0798]